MRLRTRRGRLSTKIIAWFLIPTVVILIAVAVFTFYTYQHVTEELVLERNRQLARSMAGQLSGALMEYRNQLMQFAVAPEIYQFEPLVQQNYLRRSVGRLTAFDGGVLVLDGDGVVVAADPRRPETVGQDWSDRPYIRQMIGSPGGAFSDIVDDGPEGAQVVALAAPIGSDEGVIVGMFRLDTEAGVSVFRRSIVNAMGVFVRERGTAYLVDGSGRTIYHSGGSSIGESRAGTDVVERVLAGETASIRTQNTAGEEIIASFAPIGTAPTVDSLPLLGKSLASGHRLKLSASGYAGITTQGVSSPIAGTVVTTWGLVVEESWDELTATSRRYGQLLLLLLAAGAAVPGLVIALGTRRVARPIVELTTAAQEVAGGNLGQIIEVRTGDELEELGDQFNRMSAQLQASYANLEKRVADRTRELAALNAIATVVSRSLDLHEILNDALDKTLEVMELEAGGIYLLRRHAGILTVAASQGLGDEFVGGIDNVRVGEGFSGRAVQTGTPIVVEDMVADPRLTRSLVREEGFRSAAFVPLVSKGEPVGALFVITRDVRQFSDQDVELLTSIAGQIGVAIENARLFETEQLRAEELAVLNELGQALTAQLSVDQVLEEAYRGTSRLVDTSEFFFALYDPVEHWITFPLFATDGVVRRSRVARSADRGLTGYIIRHRTPVLIKEDLPGWLAERGIELIGDVSLSWMGVPLMIGDQVLGVMAVENYTAPYAYDEHDLELLTSIASQTAIALQSARLFEEVERRLREQQALYRADEELYRHLDVDQVLQALVDVAVDILQADKSSLMVWDDARERLAVRAARGFSLETLAQMTFAPGEGTVGRVAVTGEPAIVRDTHEDDQVARRITDPEGIRSFMHMPIRIGGQVFGVFNLDYTEPRDFDKEQLRLFEALAQRAAMAIENAQLYGQAQELAAMEERQRLARDLHDAVSQTLFSASMIAGVLPRIWERNPEEGGRRLEELRQLTRGAQAEMRTLLFELRPTALVGTPLGDLLLQLGEAATGRARLPVTVDVEGEEDPPAEVKVALYRIAQEALNNAIKHAGASQVTMRLHCTPERVELRIRDDGCGFDLTDIPSGHFGVGIMRERARAIGATLSIESEMDSGTAIAVVWTVQE